LLKVLRDWKPDYIAATFDLPKPTFRHKEFEAYKAKRVKAPDELYAQIKRVKDVLRAFNIPVYEKEGYEADDVIGTLAAQACRNSKFQNPNSKIIIVTGDLDTLQLVNKKVNVFTLKKGIKDTILYDEKAVRERFGGLAPKQMVDFKGLKGDPSDNIPGVPGIGEKTAIELLKKYGSLKKLFAAVEKNPAPAGQAKLWEKLSSQKEQAFFSQYLATIKIDVPLKFDLSSALARDYDQAEVAKLFKKLGFYSLLNRLKELSGGLVAPSNESADDEKNPQPPADDESLEKIDQAFKAGVLSFKLYELEKKLLPVLRQIEKNGIKLDVKHLAKISRQVGQDLVVLEKKIYELVGQKFNVNSPQQLSEILFNRLKISVKGLKKTPGKVISTAAGELAKLKGQHPAIDSVLKYRELAKLKNTYLDALPKLVAADGRLHTSFDQLGTLTGRLSSKNPNLQNIPVKTELGQEIRLAFVAEKGNKILSADYSQIELRVVAVLAKDENMLKAFKDGRDIHTETAHEVFGVKPADVTKEMRRVAKVLNFGVIYGMSTRGFAEAASVEMSRAKEFIDKYFDKFSGVARYVEETKKQAAKNGFVQTMFGRKRFIPEVNSSAWNLRAAAERMAINMPVQGTAADIIKMAMVEIAKHPALSVKLLLQVHDELVFELPAGEIEKVAAEIKPLMEQVVEFPVPLPVDMAAGDSWGQMERVDLPGEN
jgi:DNA polymerase-1